MEEEAKGTTENCCASCGLSLPSGVTVCPKCSKTKTAEKKPVESNSRGSRGYVSVLRTPEERVRRNVANGVLTGEQGELLLFVLSRGRLLDKKKRAESTSLTMEIAEERDAKRREDRVCFLIELVAMTMPAENLDARLRLAFKA